MPIPDSPVFRTFLDSLDLKRPDNPDGYVDEVAIPASVAQDVSSEITVNERRVWSKPVDNFTLDSLLRCLRREIETSGHPTRRDVLLCLICLFCIHPKRRLAPVECLNNLLSRIVDGDVSQFLVLPLPPPSNFEDFAFGSFAVGKLNSQRLSYRSTRAQSDFFERWQHRLDGRMAIEREVCPVKVFDWISVKEQNGTSTFGDRELSSVWKDIVQAYFYFISQAYFEDFWQQFVEQQELQVAMGSPFIGDRELRLMPSASISIYLNIAGRWGFVAPHGVTFITLNFGGIDRAVPSTIRRLKQEFGVDDTATSGELHQTIKTYARFVAKAKQHLIDHRQAEAYLHFIIALDLLFGDKDSLARTITKRVAILVYQKLGVSFQQAVKMVANMYDVRSRYVHEGNSQGMSDIQTVQAICEEVLCCLLRLKMDDTKNKPGAISEWRGSLDYFVTAKETDRLIPKADLRANGIAVES